MPLRSETWNRSKTRAEYLQTMFFSVALVPMLQSHWTLWFRKGQLGLKIWFFGHRLSLHPIPLPISIKVNNRSQIWSMMIKISSNQWMSCALKQININRNFCKKLEGGTNFVPGPKFQWSNYPFKTTGSTTTESSNHRDLYCQKTVNNNERDCPLTCDWNCILNEKTLSFDSARGTFIISKKNYCEKCTS